MGFSHGWLLFFLLAVSAFFSMAEIAFASARQHRLQVLLDEGDTRAQAVLDLRAHPGNFFAVVQIALNAIAILAGVIGDGLFSPTLERWGQAAGLSVELAASVGFVLSFLFTALAFIEFSDLIPKRLGMLWPERVAMATIGPMHVLIRALHPIVFLVDGFAGFVFRLLGLSAVREEGVTAAELMALANAGAEAGTLVRQQHHLLENMVGLEGRTVGAAMTPRDQIVFISCADTDAEIKTKLVLQPHSRYLFCEKDIDSIFAYIDAKDVLRLVLQEKPEHLVEALRPLANEKLVLVPDTLSILDLLDRFNETREDFAVVMNEYALVVGIVTLYDIASQIVDGVALNDRQGWVVARDENSWLLDGQTPLDDVRKTVGIDYFPGEEGYETVAGFLMHMLKHIPARAEAVEYAGFRFEVVDVDHFKIDQILLSRIASTTAATISLP